MVHWPAGTSNLNSIGDLKAKPLNMFIQKAGVGKAVYSKCCTQSSCFILAGAGFHTLEVTRSFTTDVGGSKVNAYSCLFIISLLPGMQNILFRYEVSRDQLLQLGTHNSLWLQLYSKETRLFLQDVIIRDSALHSQCHILSCCLQVTLYGFQEVTAVCAPWKIHCI